MLEGFVVENDGRSYRMALRRNLKFHDGTPVLARDCVASVARWGKRDAFGQALMAAVDELSAPDDRTILFRLKAPFPLLPDALSKTSPSMCPIMPERLAQTDAFTQVKDATGSGPYRYVADERVPGARVVYQKFADYAPRDNGKSERTSGPKIANFDRIEWGGDAGRLHRVLGAAERRGGLVVHPGRRPAGLAREIQGHPRPDHRADRHHRHPCGSTRCRRRSTTRRSAAPSSAPCSNRTT